MRRTELFGHRSHEDIDHLSEGFDSVEALGRHDDAEPLFDDHADLDEVEGVQTEVLESCVVVHVFELGAFDFRYCVQDRLRYLGVVHFRNST